MQPWLVRAYLRSPVKPFAGQMLVDCAGRAWERSATMYGGKTVSVVLPAYNEAPYIRAAVEDFFVPGVVDEVVVVDNNSRDGTAEQAAADACTGRP